MSEDARIFVEDPFETAWLQGVPPAVLDKLRALSQRVELQNNQPVYAEGVDQNSLWGVLAGEVRVMAALSEMEPTLGHIHLPGAWLGESEPLLGIPGIVDMRAGGTVELVQIPYAKFRPLAYAHPELWEALARLTSMNQLTAMVAANDLALPTGRQRLAAAILRLCGHRGVVQSVQKKMDLRVSQQEPSGLANMRRPGLSKHLKAFENEGLVELSYASITLCDVAGIERAMFSQQ